MSAEQMLWDLEVALFYDNDIQGNCPPGQIPVLLVNFMVCISHQVFHVPDARGGFIHYLVLASIILNFILLSCCDLRDLCGGFLCPFCMRNCSARQETDI